MSGEPSNDLIRFGAMNGLPIDNAPGFNSVISGWDRVMDFFSQDAPSLFNRLNNAISAIGRM